MSSIAEREEQRRIEQDLRFKTELIAKLMTDLLDDSLSLQQSSQRATDIYLYARNRAKELIAEGL